MNIDKIPSKEIDLSISTRPANSVDIEFARKAHHIAYYDVIKRQFGKFDEEMQDSFFRKSWDPETHEIITTSGIDAGYISVERFPDHIFAKELVILPEYQGKGIGSSLLKSILQEATEKDIPVQLQVLKKNFAQDLYRRLGFKEIETNETHIKMEFSPSNKEM